MAEVIERESALEVPEGLLRPSVKGRCEYLRFEPRVKVRVESNRARGS